MSLFAPPTLAREGFSNDIARHVAIGMLTQKPPPANVDVSSTVEYLSDDLSTHRFNKLRGSVLKYLDPNLSFFASDNKNSLLIRGGKGFLFRIYFATISSDPIMHVYRSNDGHQFDLLPNLPFTTGADRGLAGFCVIGTRIYVFSRDGAGAYTDNDGDSWGAVAPSGLTRINCVATNGTTIALGGAAGSQNAIAYSSTPTTAGSWGIVNSPLGIRAPIDILWNGSLFITSGAVGTLATAPATPNAFTMRATPFDDANIRALHHHAASGRTFADYFGTHWITTANGTAWSDAASTFPFWDSDIPTTLVTSYLDNNGDLVGHWRGSDGIGRVSVFNGTAWAVKAGKLTGDIRACGRLAA